MLRYPVVLFDLDGTLTDSYEGIAKSVRHAMSTLGIDAGPEEGLRRFVGPPLRPEMQAAYGLTDEQARAALLAYRARYDTTGIYESCVYPGVPELLDALRARGARLGVASTKPLPAVERVLAHFDLARFFEVVRAPDPKGERYEKDVLILDALRSLGETNRARVAMVGDRLYDAQAARDTGTAFCGALYGYGSREELSQWPHVCLAESPARLGEFLLGGNE